MLIRNIILICLFAGFGFDCLGQWSGVYGNEWIDHSKSYLRIGVSEPGIQRINVSLLPTEFKGIDPNSYQIWWRGSEISILKATSVEILFYGLPNDGASDSLLFRPFSARLNPYVSFFSDEGSYFLTTSNKAKRAVSIDGSSLSGDPLLYHIQKDVKKFLKQFAFTVYGVESSLNNSFYVAGNSWTGSTIAGPKARRTSSVKDTISDNDFQLKGWAKEVKEKPVMEVMVNGLNEGFHDVQIFQGRSSSASDLKKISSIPFAGWDGRKIRFNLESGSLSDDGKGFLRLFSISTDFTDWSGLTYYTLTYPQVMDMKVLSDNPKLNYFNFKPTDQNNSRIGIANPTANFSLLDVSNPRNPKLIRGIASQALFEAMIPRQLGDSLILLASDSLSIHNIASSKIYKVDFNPIYSSTPSVGAQAGIDPKSNDYLIVTHTGLINEATLYGKYRASKDGGEYKVLLLDVRSIYNEFNYGEPSPIALRRFIDFMLKDGIRDKHNLLLIGPSITYQANLVKELPGEVPTFGDPGSDVLLVSGLQGKDANLPLIPVGRINAYSGLEVLGYLDKVKIYEKETDVGWRKNILHLNGGHSASEIIQLKNLLADLEPLVKDGLVGGKVKAISKQNPADVETVDISSEVNAGVGMITFFGHGSANITDMDMGNVSDPTRGYKNLNKYSLMYFNGCGVGNIYSRRTPPTLSDDWVLTSDKGAIAVLANSYFSYVSSSQKYLGALYKTLFVASENMTIGHILIKSAGSVLASSTNAYDVANIHQTNLQGDPALVLIRASRPDYAIDIQEGIFISSEVSDKKIGELKNFKIGVLLSNLGKFNKDETLAIRVRVEYRGGTDQSYEKTVPAIPYSDTLLLEIENSGLPIQRLVVNIDPDNKVLELNETNNSSELEVNWDVAANEYLYPVERIKDVIPPTLRVNFNDRQLSNNEIINPNPKISFLIEDDRLLHEDVSLLNVYLKSCGDETCDFVKLDFSLQTVQLETITDRFIRINLLSELKEGNYSLLVSAQDMSGNTISNPYNITFKIGVVEQKSSLVVSPNPSSEYFMFTNLIGNGRILKMASYQVTDIRGIELDNEQLILNFGLNDTHYQWYWKPGGLPSGIYFYKIIFAYTDGGEESLIKRLVIVK